MDSVVEEAPRSLRRTEPSTMPDGWGFCMNRLCRCWDIETVACEEWVSLGGHPFDRCARCGVTKRDHHG